jgi:hypothetical protein
MKKSKRRKGAKGAVSAEKAKSKTKAAEYVGNLIKLHKIQGTLLNRLEKEV